MKRIFYLLVWLFAGTAAQAQETQAESAVQPMYASPVTGDKLPVDSAVGPTQTPEYQIIDGRKVKVDAQGVQSLEVVNPVPVAQPAAKETVQ